MNNLDRNLFGLQLMAALSFEFARENRKNLPRWPYTYTWVKRYIKKNKNTLDKALIKYIKNSLILADPVKFSNLWGEHFSTYQQISDKINSVTGKSDLDLIELVLKDISQKNTFLTGFRTGSDFEITTSMIDRFNSYGCVTWCQDRLEDFTAGGFIIEQTYLVFVGARLQYLHNIMGYFQAVGFEVRISNLFNSSPKVNYIYLYSAKNQI